MYPSPRRVARFRGNPVKTPIPKRWAAIITGLAVLMLLSIALALGVGTTALSPSGIWNGIFGNTDTIESGIILGIRLPRVIMGVAVGGALSVAGTLLQGLFRNPLVEPYTLGISGGASLGVCLCLLFGLPGLLGIVAFPLAGFAGAGTVILLVYSLGMRSGSLRPNTMLLIGVMISFVSSSLVMLLMAVSRSDDLSNIVFWIMGSLDEPNRTLIKLVMGGSIAGLILSMFYSVKMNALTLGDEEASLLGIDTVLTRKVLFVTASLLTGLSVSASGIIMFVGLIVPHFMRMFAGSDHRILIPSSFLAGACFLTLCDVIARVIISPLELPVGVITGIIGGIVFIYVLSQKRVAL
ncbi:MAG: iron ABC transporter permease [Desulfobacteraceae bacterium]|nr:MAG: iron ABC transporter permease [Desulfobacteraceae bacterium]